MKKRILFSMLFLFVGIVKDTPTGIQPTIVAVEADGTCHYFNLQGQQLKDKPQKGIYISNGIKHISK